MAEKNNYLELLPNAVKKFDEISWQSVAKFILAGLVVVALAAVIRG